MAAALLWVWLLPVSAVVGWLAGSRCGSVLPHLLRLGGGSGWLGLMLSLVGGMDGPFLFGVRRCVVGGLW